jgi:hypothetical protein
VPWLTFIHQPLLAVSWVWAAGLGGLAGLVLGVVLGGFILRQFVASAIRTEIDFGLPRLEDQRDRLVKLDHELVKLEKHASAALKWVRAELKSSGLLSTWLTIGGMVLGVVGGFTTGWVENGGWLGIGSVWVRGGMVLVSAAAAAWLFSKAITRWVGKHKPEEEAEA